MTYHEISLNNWRIIGFNKTWKTFGDNFLNFVSIFIKFEMFRKNSATILNIKFQAIQMVNICRDK